MLNQAKGDPYPGGWLLGYADSCWPPNYWLPKSTGDCWPPVRLGCEQTDIERKLDRIIALLEQLVKTNNVEIVVEKDIDRVSETSANTNSNIRFRDWLEKRMADPKFQAEWEASETAYQLARLVAQARMESPSPDWEREIDEL